MSRITGFDLRLKTSLKELVGWLLKISIPVGETRLIFVAQAPIVKQRNLFLMLTVAHDHTFVFSADVNSMKGDEYNRYIEYIRQFLENNKVVGQVEVLSESDDLQRLVIKTHSEDYRPAIRDLRKRLVEEFRRVSDPVLVDRIDLNGFQPANDFQKHKLTYVQQDLKEKVTDLFNKGMTNSYIAFHAACSESQVKRILRKLGLRRRPKYKS